ncbi:g3821 [Coccomyxa elongata]
MKTFAFALVALCLAVAVSGDVCHYDCYSVDPTAGKAAKQALLQACGVMDYKFGTSTANNLAAIYMPPPPAGCMLAVCARFPNEDAVNAYRNGCEHPKPQYAVLSGKGVNHDAPCTACPTS